MKQLLGLRLLFTLLVLLQLGNAAYAAAPEGNDHLAGNGLSPFNTARTPESAWLHEIVGYLAGPDCNGRRVGTPGAELAAEYLESQLKLCGVEPLPGQTGYRQEFPVTRGIKPVGFKASLTPNPAPGQPAVSQTVALDQDCRLAPFCGSGEVAAAPLVFAGYGISAPELGWDDYAGLDAKGAVAVIVRGEPQEKDKDSKFSGDQPSVYSDLRRKAAAAKAHGVAALLVLENPLEADDPQADELPEIRPAWGGSSSDLPVLHLRRAIVAPAIEQAEGHPLLDILRAMDSHGITASTALPASFSLSVQVEKDELPAWNLVGIIPGSDPELAEEYVAIGAHYDHLGIGGPESLAPQDYGQPHWGADDNASGDACVLDIARSLARGPRPARSVLVCLFSGEEIGLVGSNWLVEHPPVPLDSIVAMLNFDMVGRLRDEKLTMGGTGTAQEFPALIKGIDSGKLNVVAEESGFGSSDHMSFIQKGIPSLFFFTGTHPDYHTPRDTADKINYEGIGEVAGYAERVAGVLLAGKTRFTYVRPEVSTKPTRSRAGLKVTLGTVPDYSKEDVKGMAIADVLPGGPAAVAGFTGGDVIVQIGEVQIGNIYDFMYALQDKQPDDEVDVTVQRGSDTLHFKVRLAARNVQE
jgi:hypothetical protein